jgi:hypothetical protein
MQAIYTGEKGNRVKLDSFISKQNKTSIFHQKQKSCLVLEG